MQLSCIKIIKLRLILEKSDIFGAVASTLCLVHCIATPFIFIAHSCAAHSCTSAPGWWSGLDYLFLIVSFFAVKRSAKQTAKPFMKPALWISWGTLLILVLNEKVEGVDLPEVFTHISAITLAVLHIYNLKFCQCQTNTCCTRHV